jgi:hypothetical protein
MVQARQCVRYVELCRPQIVIGCRSTCSLFCEATTGLARSIGACWKWEVVTGAMSARKSEPHFTTTWPVIFGWIAQ